MTRRSTGVRWLLAPALVALVLLPPSVARAQEGGWLEPEALASAWLGGVTEEHEATLPASPQGGLRLEGTLEGRIWAGVEGSLTLVNTRLDCIDPTDGSCGETILRSPWVVSGFLRVEVTSGDARRYVVGSLGRADSTRGSATVWGLGVGTRLPDLVGSLDLMVEVRYREGSRFQIETIQRWEVMGGVALGGVRSGPETR